MFITRSSSFTAADHRGSAPLAVMSQPLAPIQPLPSAPVKKKKGRVSLWKHLPFTRKKKDKKAKQQHRHSAPAAPPTPHITSHTNGRGAAEEEKPSSPTVDASDSREWTYEMSLKLRPKHIQSAVIVHRRKVLESGEEVSLGYPTVNRLPSDSFNQVAVRSNDLIIILTKAATKKIFGEDVDGDANPLTAEDVAAELVESESDEEAAGDEAQLKAVMRRHSLGGSMQSSKFCLAPL